MKPKRSVIIFIVCFLWMQNFAFAQPLKDLPLDSLVSWLSDNYTTKGDSIYRYAHAALQQARMKKDWYLEAKSYENLAFWFFHHGITQRERGDSVLFYDQKALEAYLKLGNKKYIAKAYSYLAADYNNQGKYRQGEDLIFKSIENFEAVNDQEGIASNYYSLAILNLKLENYRDVIKYGQQAINIHQSLQDTVEEALVLFFVVDAWSQLGEHDKALAAANRTFELIKPYEQKDIGLRARACFFRGRAYKSMGRYEEALKDLREGWECDKSQMRDDTTRADGSLREIGAVLYLQGKYKAALPVLLAGYRHAIRFNQPEFIWDDLNYIAGCYEQLGDYPNALKYKTLAYTARDSIQTNKIQSLQSELLVKYESEQKDKTISTQQAQISQQRQIQVLSFSVAGLFLLLSGALYWVYRNNRRSSRKLETLNVDLANKNTQLDRRNAENELLLKEIHHRVKNNLEMVSSLLLLQSRQVDDPSVREVMEEGQNRVQSIGIVHQKLYQGDNLSSIEMKDYFINLSEGILDTFDAEDRIQIECIMDKLELDVDTAVPIGLIVNELLTNALKYAFPNGQSGKVKIQLETTDDNYLRLEVADNGIGKVTQTKGTGFGSQLIHLLTQQLGGILQEEVKNGTVVRLEFKKNRAA